MTFSLHVLGWFFLVFPHSHASAGTGCQYLLGCFGLWRTSPQLHFLVPVSSEQTEEAEKEDLRVQLKRHHPSSPLPGSKTSKRPKIKVSLVSQGDTAGGPCTPSQGGAPEGEFLLASLNKHRQNRPRRTVLPPWWLLAGRLSLAFSTTGTRRRQQRLHVGGKRAATSPEVGSGRPNEDPRKL